MKTNAAPLSSNTNALAGLPDDIRGIKAPVEIPDPWTWLWWTLALLLLAALAYWAWRRWKSRKPLAESPSLSIPAHEKALAALHDALAFLGQPRPFCIRVSDTVRVYLEERFSLHAPERTTEEFLEELQFSAFLTFDQKQTLGEFLSRCDLVKFARYEPGEPELRQLHEAAIRLVEETQPAPPVPEAASPAPAANP